VHSRYIRAILAVILVTGVASASFYISSKISNQKSVSLSSPDSTPLAAKLESEEAAFINKSKNTKKAAAIVTTKPTSAIVKKSPIISKDDRDEIAAERAAIASKAVSPTANATPAQSTSTYNPTAFLSPSATPIVTAAPAAAIPTPKPGSFGSTATDIQKSNISYMSDKANDCTDGLGFVSGTGCFNGERRVLGNADTQQAYQQHVQDVKNDLISLTTEQILAKAGKTCDPAVQNCQKIIEESQKIVFNQNIVLGDDQIEMAKIRTQTQALKDITNSSISDEYLKNTYGNKDVKVILSNLGIDPATIQSAASQRQNILAEKAKADNVTAYNNLIAANSDKINDFTNPNISNTDLAQKYCSTQTDTQRGLEDCKTKFKRTDLISVVDKNTDAYKELIKFNTDLDLTRYAATFDQKQLERTFCSYQENSSLCNNKGLSVISPGSIIESISNPELKVIAQKNRNAYLETIIITNQAKEEYFKRNKTYAGFLSNVALSPEIVSEAKEYNNKVSTALAVFAQEQINKNPKNPIDSDAYAREFNNLINKDPNKLTEYFNKFTSNKALYQPILDSGLYRLAPNEANATIVVENKDRLKNVTIAGLSDNGKIKIYKDASPEFQELALKKACATDTNLKVMCHYAFMDGIDAGVEDGAKSYRKQLEDKVIASKTNYLQLVFNDQIGANIQASTAFSNIASLNNPLTAALHPELIKDINKDLTKKVYVPTLSNTGKEIGKQLATLEQKELIAEEKIYNRLVNPTYTQGGGMVGALVTASVITGVATFLVGPEVLLATPWLATVIAGTAGLGAVAVNTAPIWGEKTAVEIAQEQKAMQEKYNLSDSVAGLAYSAFHNQGAACDTVDGIRLGGSCTRQNNSNALYSNMQLTNAQFGGVQFDNPDYSANLILNVTKGQKFDALAETENKIAIANIISAPIIAGFSGAIGSNLAKTVNLAEKAIPVENAVTALLKQRLNTLPLTLGNSALGAVQNEFQIAASQKNTVTPEVEAYEICKTKNGVSACQKELAAVKESNSQSAMDQRLAALAMDMTMNFGQEIFSFTAEYNALQKLQSNTPSQIPNSTLEFSTLPSGSEIIFNANNLDKNSNISEINNLILATKTDSSSQKNPLPEAKTRALLKEEAIKIIANNSQMPNNGLKELLIKSGFTSEEADVNINFVKETNLAQKINDPINNAKIEEYRQLQNDQSSLEQDTLLAQLESEISTNRDQIIKNTIAERFPVADISENSGNNIATAMSDTRRPSTPERRYNQQTESFDIVTQASDYVRQNARDFNSAEIVTAMQKAGYQDADISKAISSEYLQAKSEFKATPVRASSESKATSVKELSGSGTPSQSTPRPVSELNSNLTPKLANDLDVNTSGFGHKYFLGISEAVDVANNFHQQGGFEGPNVSPLNTNAQNGYADVYVFKDNGKEYVIKKPKNDGIADKFLDRYGTYYERVVKGDAASAKISDISFANTQGLQLDNNTEIFIQKRVQGISPTNEEFDLAISPKLQKAENEGFVIINDRDNPNNWIIDPADGEYYFIDTEGAFYGPDDLIRATEFKTGANVVAVNDSYTDPFDEFRKYRPSTSQTPPAAAARTTRGETPPLPPRKPNSIAVAVAEAITPPTDTNKNSTSFFKPNDNIYQAIPGDSNIIGKVPDINTESNKSVYYRTSEMDMGNITNVSSPTKLSENFNPLPTNGKPYLLEFGTIDSNGNFVKITPNALKDEGTQTLAINISNEYSFGKPGTVDQSPKSKTNPIKTGVQTAKNAVANLPEKAGLPAATKPPQTSPTTNSITQRIKVLFTENLPQVSSRLKLTEQEILTLNYLEELRITKAKNNQDLNNFSESTPTGDRTPLIRNAEDDIKALAQKYKDLGLDINQDAPSRPIGLTDTGDAILKIKEFLSDNIPSTAKVKPQAEASPKTPTSTKPTVKKVIGLGTDEATARYLHELEGLKNKGRGQMSESSKLDPDTNFGPYNEVLVRQALELAEKYGITLRPGSFDPVGQSSISIAIQKLINIFVDPRPNTPPKTNPVRQVVSNPISGNNSPQSKVVSTAGSFDHDMTMDNIRIKPDEYYKKSEDPETLSDFNFAEINEMIEEAKKKPPIQKPRNITSSEPTPINNSEKNMFNISKKFHPDKYLRNILGLKQAEPYMKVTVNDNTFYLSKLIMQTDGREVAVIYTRTPDGRLVARAAYKSNSDGGWRVTPGPKPMGDNKYIYSKGKSIHYTQETKPAFEISNILNGMPIDLTYKGDFIKDLIPSTESTGEFNTYNSEVSKANTPTLEVFQKYRPGKYSLDKFVGTNFTEAFKNFKYPKGFIPDFTKKPIRTYRYKHTLLGNTIVEIHSGMLEGRVVEWAMARTVKGDIVWAESIYYPDSPITSYGTRAEIIDSGALTNKPLEYSVQTDYLSSNEKTKFNDTYSNISPLLNNLEPIKQFRGALKKR